MTVDKVFGVFYNHKKNGRCAGIKRKQKNSNMPTRNGKNEKKQELLHFRFTKTGFVTDDQGEAVYDLLNCPRTDSLDCP